MVIWHKLDNKLVGFTYYPLLQILVGVFFIICALIVPGFYFYINGYKNSNFTESIISILFLLFFGWLGKNLVYQWFDFFITSSEIIVNNTIAEPHIFLRININSTINLSVKEFATELANNQFCLIINYNSNSSYISNTEISQNSINEIIIHKSISKNEIEEIKNSIEKLLKSKNINNSISHDFTSDTASQQILENLTKPLISNNQYLQTNQNNKHNNLNFIPQKDITNSTTKEIKKEIKNE